MTIYYVYHSNHDVSVLHTCKGNSNSNNLALVAKVCTLVTTPHNHSCFKTSTSTLVFYCAHPGHEPCSSYRSLLLFVTMCLWFFPNCHSHFIHMFFNFIISLISNRCLEQERISPVMAGKKR